MERLWSDLAGTGDNMLEITGSGNTRLALTRKAVDHGGIGFAEGCG